MKAMMIPTKNARSKRSSHSPQPAAKRKNNAPQMRMAFQEEAGVWGLARRTDHRLRTQKEARKVWSINQKYSSKGICPRVPTMVLFSKVQTPFEAMILSQKVEKMTARACGVKHYITKPFNPQDLLNIVEDVDGKGRE